jgi:uncharacterized surface protein with fasciclin (FAS1) repeats
MEVPMKTLLTTLAALTALSVAGVAHADNPAIENALAKRADLSGFYQALLNSGVNHELQAGRPYTVFAPTDAALSRFSQIDYTCFQDDACRQDVAILVRNHIVPGELHVEDIVRQRGGVYTLDNRFVNIGQPSRNNYAVEGNRILSASQHGRNVLYKIDGVIVTPDELALLKYPHYAYEPAHVTTSMREVPEPSPCLADGCPQSVARTTTTTVIGPLIPNE